MNADQLVTAAREYLDAVMSHAVPTLPPTALAREVAELRRHLRGVLNTVEDLVPVEFDETRTQVTLWGGLYFAPDDVATLLRALLCAAECLENHHADESSLDQAARIRQLTDPLGGAS